MLIITNGESAEAALRRAGFKGPILAWDDVLHEGPVPGRLRLRALSRVRSQFLAAQGWGEPGQILRAFRRRDSKLQSLSAGEEAVLWFEHDLYDQLQLLQLLSWFGRRPRALRPRLTLVCQAEFVALCQPERLQVLFQQRGEIGEKHLAAGRMGWTAFRASEPWEVARLANSPVDALPFLAPALKRLIQEYPAASNGASRTEQQILETVAGQPATPGEIFGWTQQLEEAPYLGDTPFWTVLERLGSGPRPLMLAADGKPFLAPRWGETASSLPLRLTEMGERVLAMQEDLVKLIGIDRWLGGVHLRPGQLWRREEL